MWRRYVCQLFLGFVVTLCSAAILWPAFLLYSGRCRPADGDWGAGMSAALCLLALGWSFRRWQQGYQLRSTPLSRIRSAAQGFVRLDGQTSCLSPVRSLTGNIAALYYREVRQRYERREETYQDEKGRTKKRVRYAWRSVPGVVNAAPFLLDDGTGQAEVTVHRAEFHPTHSASFYNGRPGWYGGRAPRVNDIRTRVNYIPPVSRITVWGRYEREESSQKRVVYDLFTRCLLIVEGDPARIALRRIAGALAGTVVGMLAGFSCVWSLLHP
jgi:hypothetical protein